MNFTIFATGIGSDTEKILDLQVNPEDKMSDVVNYIKMSFPCKDKDILLVEVKEKGASIFSSKSEENAREVLKQCHRFKLVLAETKSDSQEQDQSSFHKPCTIS